MVTVESPSNTPPMETPCVKICTLDARARRCLGCRRTIDEIAGWSRMSDAERSRVMAELPARLAGTVAATE